MDTIRRLVVMLMESFMRLLLYGAATATVLLIVIGDRNGVKYAIEQSGAYDKFVPSIIEYNRNASQESSIPLDDERVIAIINQAFPPEVLQENAEIVIDGVYNWLEGSTGSVTFTADFTERKNILGDELSRYAFTNLAFMSECLEQPEVFDPFTIDCRPLKYDVFGGEKDFAEQIKSAQGFLGDTILTQDDLPKNSEGKNIFQRYAYAPVVYGWVKRAPFILAVMIILTAWLYVYFSPSHRRALSKIGRTIAGSGLTLLLAPLVFSIIIPWMVRGYESNLAGSSADIILNDILSTIQRFFDRLMMYLGLSLSLLGLSIIVAERAFRSKARYTSVEQRTGMVSSQAATRTRGYATRTNRDIPLQSSEQSATKIPKRARKNAKYRKIPL